MAFKFEYGQTVRLAAFVPASLKIGENVAIVGMTKLNRERRVFDIICPVGTDVYTIEYSDGSSVELPEKCLEPIKENQ